jgi:hypothetical protein
VAKTRKLSRNFRVGFVVVFVVAIVIGLLAALLIPVHPNSARILIFVGATFLVGGMFGIVGAVIGITGYKNNKSQQDQEH